MSPNYKERSDKDKTKIVRQCFALKAIEMSEDQGTYRGLQRQW